MTESLHDLLSEMRLKFRYTTDRFVQDSFSTYLPTLTSHINTTLATFVSALQDLVLHTASTVDFSSKRPASELAEEIISALRDRVGFPSPPKAPSIPGLEPRERAIFQRPTDILGHLATTRIEDYADDTVLRVQRLHPDTRSHASTSLDLDAWTARTRANRAARFALVIKQAEEELTGQLEKEKERLMRLVKDQLAERRERMAAYVEAAECWLRVVYDVFPRTVIEVGARMDVHSEREKQVERWDATRNELWKLQEMYYEEVRRAAMRKAQHSRQTAGENGKAKEEKRVGRGEEIVANEEGIEVTEEEKRNSKVKGAMNERKAREDELAKRLKEILKK